ncbi:MAG: DUF192 domain-containing protein [Chloroflexi bacterium]|nr:DUF192 domain-containing protein [Chloroflexota bacterium]
MRRRTKPRRTKSCRAASGLLIALAALIVMACGPTQDFDTPNDGGVIAPAVERPAEIDRFLQLPDGVAYIDFPWSEVEVERATGTLTVGVLIANTSERRSRGMMYRSGLPERSGMIFIWENTRAQTGGFWNPNVPIDLDVAWLDADGSIMEFTVLIAGDRTIKAPQEPYYFVMEMPRGRFAALGIEHGDRVVIPPTLLPR